MAFLLFWMHFQATAAGYPVGFFTRAPIIKEPSHPFLDLDQGLKKKVKFLYNLILLECTPEK